MDDPLDILQSHREKVQRCIQKGDLAGILVLVRAMIKSLKDHNLVQHAQLLETELAHTKKELQESDAVGMNRITVMRNLFHRLLDS